MGTRQHQAMFVRIEKGHALIFVLTAKAQPLVEEAIAMVGLQGTVPIQQATITTKKSSTVAARTVTKKDAAAANPQTPNTKATTQDPAWASAIKLQGIGGTTGRRLAIINGKTLGTGDGTQVVTGGKTVVIRCVAIRDNSVTVTIDGLDGERELRLN